ncbi:MAG: hypothetical protein UY41_C0049G0007 [Candidatus Moranbacteria bacterium GW2011_GWE1_49_15]|nr:MAG: hypothetical protein UX75_C0044G0007 [Candidatus Moranbacteria bacterium GW2011_GWE2_47_10]KKW05505.1 MAG: hypothetical protein UY41_C0049G0007 [Candidatus Moranbacteria bacterium GW2011_GWE1_49_15]HBP01246.1 hypothetical protein [Candidatus Moranbacteria bacterium]
MKDLIQKTIARLKKEKMKPLPKWRFVLLDVAYWSLVALAVLFSAVAAAAGIYLLFQIDWEASRYAPGGTLGTFFLYVPYVWLAVLAILLGAVYYFIRKTKEGYRYRWAVILLTSLSLVLAMGTAAHFARIGMVADDFAYRRVPLYRDVVPGMEHMWQRAEDGFLAGEIESVGRDKFSIVDLEGKKWDIVILENTVRRGPFEIEEGGWVKVVGKPLSDDVFEAQVIMTGGGRMMRGFDRGLPRREEFRRDFDGRWMRGEGGMMRGPGYGWE